MSTNDIVPQVPVPEIPNSSAAPKKPFPTKLIITIIGAILIVSLLWYLRAAILWCLNIIGVIAVIGLSGYLLYSIYECYIAKKAEEVRIGSIMVGGLGLAGSAIFVGLVHLAGIMLVGGSIPGRSAKIQVHTANILEEQLKVYPGGKHPNVEYTVFTLNDTIKNPRASIDGGTIHLLFDIDFEKWPFTIHTFCPDDGNHHITSGRSFMVRYFDDAGKYIGHFITKEKYVAEWALKYNDLNPFINASGRMTWLEDKDVELMTPIKIQFYPLISRDNHLSYQINRRDADYVHMIEIGFYTPGGEKDCIHRENLRLGEKEYLNALKQATSQRQKDREINEENIVSSLKLYAKAQSIFKKENYSSKLSEPKLNTYAPTLHDLYTGGAIASADAKKLISEDMELAAINNAYIKGFMASYNGRISSAYNGYYFIVGDTSNLAKNYELWAIPYVYGESGINTYFIDSTGNIKKEDMKGKKVFEPSMGKKLNIEISKD